MANEYLKRTPTSSGNSRRWTLSFWMKNSDPTQGYTAIVGAGKLSPTNVYNEIFYNSGQFGINLDNSSASDNYVINANPLLRDSSSWMHVIVSLTDQGDNANTRMKFYINGAFVDHNTGTGLDVSETSFFNDVDYIHYIGSRAQQSAGTTTFDGQYFDIFNVDGQALTPDVFGFYKDGDGYISAGSTQSTDFRPGQWVPKSPSVIKNVINNSGGFGVNGYYLPMNDSSNPGADFHCDPNSIITLKGEDLPQPRNGAPTTTDAYVSELRSDPNAANIVLAVPGASIATGNNLVENGSFDSNINSWIATDNTQSWNNGQLQINRSGGGGGTSYQAFTTEVGKRYTVVGTVNSSGSRGDIRVYDGTGFGGTTLLAMSGTAGQIKTLTGSFTAASTTTSLGFSVDNNGTTIYVDNIEVKQEDAPRDYSADIKGSGTNKTLTANGNAGVGYELGGYYGSAMTFDGTGDYFTVPNTADLRMGSDDFTIEAWVNKNDTDSGAIFALYDNGNDRRSYLLYSDNSNDLTAIVSTSGDSGGNTMLGGSDSTNLGTNQWNHCVMEREGSYFRLYLNGVVAGIATDLSGSIYENTTDTPAIGTWFNSGVPTGDTDGQIQDLRVYKGVAKYKGGFDVPKPYTPVGIESWRATTDTCSNNFATWNALDKEVSVVLSNGNLSFIRSAGWGGTGGTLGLAGGKYYWEIMIDSSSAYSFLHAGISDGAKVQTNKSGGFVGSVLYFSETNTVQVDGGSDIATGLTLGIGDVLQIVYDATTRGFYVGVNGTFANSGNPVATATAGYDYVPIAQSATTPSTVNFGQNPSFSGQVTAGTNADDSGKGLFKYAPPSGFLALCEDNLPTPAIADPGDYMRTVLWEGDSNTGRSITGVGFKPDLVWVKHRNTAGGHGWFDSVRGPGLRLDSQSTGAETSATGVMSFDSDGFSLGSVFNTTNRNTVAWCWKAGGAAVTNTDGTITSQVSVNQTAGFSIVSYTGTGANATVGHGLGKAPKMVIVKNRDSTLNWIIWHIAIAGNQYLRFATNAVTNLGTVWNSSTPTSSIINLGSSIGTNESTSTFIAYCWAEIEGYSKFGSYIGNASTDGPFVYTGGKPALVMYKRTDTTGDWAILDSSRQSTNPLDLRLFANNTNIDTTGVTSFDFLSNGFKIRDSAGSINASGGTYIFACFMESPFTTANAK